MALWVSFSDWYGPRQPVLVERRTSSDCRTTRTSPPAAAWPSATSASRCATTPGTCVLVVPLQTALSLFLAVLVSRAILRGRGFFRTALLLPVRDELGRDHHPVAVPVLDDRRRQRGARRGSASTARTGSTTRAGIVHLALGKVGSAGPDWLVEHDVPRRHRGGNGSAGPSVAMFAFILMAVFTTSGTFMLLFVAALQNIGADARRGRA